MDDEKPTALQSHFAHIIVIPSWWGTACRALFLFTNLKISGDEIFTTESDILDLLKGCGKRQQEKPTCYLVAMAAIDYSRHIDLLSFKSIGSHREISSLSELDGIKCCHALDPGSVCPFC
jgi:hypothetical protein